MYFKKLEIFGFKSFAEKTVLHFEPGLTAIVGPNGCGKSNVFDSIRWVLGEQSAKQLRGSGMEDVIFNGTDTKLALGFAEVSVTFDNASRMLAVNADEVVITRRLFRSGESEYLINKEVMRLKDVTELFMGTGVGAEAYSLVQQGRVDLVVSAKPEDRRMIFDEASGITKYKAKKREAQSKLKDTDQNLLRLNDIVIEVKRQISSIERQASKARRYKEEFEKLKAMEMVFACWQLGMAEKEREEIQRFLDEAKDREVHSAGELDEFRQTVERETMALEDLEIKIQEVREQGLKIENQIELQRRQISFNEERLQNLAENEGKITGQRSELMEKSRQTQERLAELEQSLAQVVTLKEQYAGVLGEKKAALASISGLLDEFQLSIRNDEEKVLQLTSRQIEIRNQMTENLKETQSALGRRRRLEMEQGKVSSEREAAERKLQGISQGITEILAKRQRLNDDAAREKALLTGQSEELSQITSRLEGLERKKLFLISQKEFIEKLQVQYQDIPDPIITGRFLSSIPPSEKQTGVIGKVKTVSSFEPERFETLKQYLSNLEGERMYEVICETKFIELDPQEMAGKIDAIDAEIRDLTAQREVKTVAVAEQSRLIERIQQEIYQEEKRLSVSEAQQMDMSSEARKLWEEFEAVRLETEETDRVLGQLKEAEGKLQVDMTAIDAEITALQNGIKGRLAEIQDKRREREELAVALAQVESEAAGFADKEAGINSNLTLFRREMASCLDALGRLDEESASFNERRGKYLQELEALNGSIVTLENERQGLTEIMSRHETERQDVEQRLSSVRAQINSMEKDIADHRDMLHERQMRIQQVSFQEQSIKERVLQRYNIDLSVNPAPAAEMPAAAPIIEEGQIVDGQPSAEAPALPAPGPVAMGRVEIPADFNPDAMAQEIQTLSKRCDSFGAVNLVAIEEFEELKTRFQFLTKQQSDLITAKESLEQTIRKINKETRQRFVDTFTKVNEQFRSYFKMLFNGGEAQLILVDPENALESGIEIVARPPGKKLQTISLLSGGEKTMTAIALIFSVFKVNPSPFCVLDEIDAALDEANVDRFANVLKEFAKIAQFIIITHNKKTIAHADVMYGVTMQQTGVSRVVSVKLSDRSSQAAPAAAASVAAQPEESAARPQETPDSQEALTAA